VSDSSSQDSGYATPQEMRGWLVQEILDCTKATELRVKEAIGLVTEYEQGKITPDQASQRLTRYEERWGEALFGATAGKTMSDEQIIATIDDARSKQWASELARDRQARSR
jgi:hypothetical protein